MNSTLDREIERPKDWETTEEETQSNIQNSNIQNSNFKTSSSFSVRSYAAADYPVVLELWEQAKLRPFTDMEIERLLRSGGGALVAVRYENTGSGENREVNECVIGIVLWSHNGSIGILWRLAVAESARGQGIATRLLDRAEQDIREAGLSGVSLLTRVNNTVAKGIYARRGYRWNDHLEFWGKKLPAPLDTELNELSSEEEPAAEQISLPGERPAA